MRKITGYFFLFFCCSILAQEKDKNHYFLDASYFYGTIAEHNPDLAHLITGHPTGLILSFNRKTFGKKAWERRYNYPDIGYSFTYQDMKNPYLGDNYGLYAHMNFYFFKRNLMLRIGQGLAMTSDPYHPDDNFRNKAYGSRLLSSTYLMANYKKENIFEGLGLQGGISLIHYSNADFKSPNASTNTFTFNLGLNYRIGENELPSYVPKRRKEKYTEPFHYNFVLRSGVNTMGVIGSEQYPFLTLTAFADKVVNHKSTLQAGTELFLSKAMEERIRYESIAFPLGETEGDEDAKRIGAFVGHQLTFNKLSVITQLGYYVYYPYEHYVERLYNRIGLKRIITPDLWGSITVRSHWANAEAVEFSIGYRL
ncbi:acyloxyacyl hydrolase [Salegentibacter chungangensis]|uniref:Acyloxyacyl hydrolase n=1 Tax=Salegentibacter chungangensis TaxID=1335724 RepID=A0ABW3NQZ0_9FLAO